MDILNADWPAPKTIRALSTCRQSGHSLPPYDQCNVALHVGDSADHVLANRALLQEHLKLCNKPEWLNQTHSTRCIAVDNEMTRDGDAAFTRDPKRILAIMTADCLPILICNQEGTEIAAIHAGWRGLLNGIIENTIKQLHTDPSRLMAWIGPSICAQCYEVGDEIQKAFTDHNPHAFKRFKTSPRSSITNPKWFADLPKLAEDRLNSINLHAVYQSNICTFEQKDRFYSYRRTAQTGRIVSLIWFAAV